jgi:hypothetical protein
VTSAPSLTLRPTRSLRPTFVPTMAPALATGGGSDASLCLRPGRALLLLAGAWALGTY